MSNDDIIEKIVLPTHNKDCEGCLERALHISAIHKAAQMLSGSIHLVKESIEELAKQQQLLIERISLLEDLHNKEAIVLQADKKWMRRIFAVLLASGGLLGWIAKVLWDHFAMGK